MHLVGFQYKNLIICSPRQISFGWSNRGKWDGLGI